jgi:hypothetical protein
MVSPTLVYCGRLGRASEARERTERRGLPLVLALLLLLLMLMLLLLLVLLYLRGANADAGRVLWLFVCRDLRLGAPLVTPPPLLLLILLMLLP